MRIHQLEVLVAVVDSETMSEAAASVNLSTSAVSLQMKRLALELKTELFVRFGRTLLPTPACIRLADQARILIARFNAIEREFGSRKGKRV